MRKKKDKKIHNQQENFESETEMDEINNNNNNPNNENNRVVTPFIPEAALYDWA